MYLLVREILALAADYQPEDPETQVFFQTVQNKLHFAVSGKTAPELIAERTDSTRTNMGLTSWRGAVVRRGDVTIAKNYLNEQEITELNRIVTMFLDFAEVDASHSDVCRRPACSDHSGHPARHWLGSGWTVR